MTSVPLAADRITLSNAANLFELCALRNRDGVEMHWGMVQKLVEIAYEHGAVIAKAIRSLPPADGPERGVRER